MQAEAEGVVALHDDLVHELAEQFPIKGVQEVRPGLQGFDQLLGLLDRLIFLGLQEPFLFSRTIRENIGITKEKLLDEEIRHAAEIACVDESILHFTDGYDTIVGERGVTLSGGQKQRVAIARMLMKEAPILVFDDSLSAVDTETDNKIRKELKKEMEKATVIMISHRITSLMQADCIIVMDKGVIQQMGTHEELIHQEGPYKDIYEIQMNSDIRLMEGGAACE